MEDILQESKHSLTSPGNHDAQMRLVVLVGLLILAIVVAVFVFNTSRSTAPVAVAPPADMTVVTPTPDALAFSDVAPEMQQIAGYVAGVVTGLDGKGKWIDVEVQTLKSGTIAPEMREEPTIPPDMETLSYKFYLGEHVEGFESIIGGENIIVSFYGEPSETEYAFVLDINFTPAITQLSVNE